MPLHAELNIVTHGRIDVYAMGGKAAHGFFLEMVRRRDPDAAQRLHEPSPVKPFTLSVSAPTVRRGNVVTIPEGEMFRLRITILDDTVLEPVFHAILDALAGHEPFQFSGMPVTVQTTSDTAPVLRKIAWEKLIKDASISDDLVGLHFVSPTAFRRINDHHLYPEPDLVFGSILRKWNTYADTPLKMSSETAFSSIRVSRYRLKTQMLRFRGFNQLGFVGQSYYDLKRLSQTDKSIVSVLARFAQISGVGAKTTMGMGITRQIMSRPK